MTKGSCFGNFPLNYDINEFSEMPVDLVHVDLFFFNSLHSKIK